MKETVKSIILPRTVRKQPIPHISQGGDCGACVVAGMLDISVSEAYDFHQTGEYSSGDKIPKTSAWNQRSMRNTLELLTNDLGCSGRLLPTLLEHVVVEVPIFPFNIMRKHELAFGLNGHSQFWAWTSYLRAMLHGGFYGLATVFNNGFKTAEDFKLYGETNHWVLIRGWRYAYEKNEDPNRLCIGSYEQEILIGNSAHNSPDEEWLPIDKFLLFWGGFTAMWAKPK